MKNQYFGDVRDLFKYDIIKEICRSVQGIKQFTFIPMLTPDDRGLDGNKRDYLKSKAGANNLSLIAFLKEKSPFKDYRKIKDYFTSEGLQTVFYPEDNDILFNKANRDSYFHKIPAYALNDSLIFIDPDNGMEIKKSSEKHVLYKELRHLYVSMSNNSILMVIQFFERMNHQLYIEKQSKNITEISGGRPLYISDNEITFYFLTKSENVRNELVSVLKCYTDKYKSLFFG